LFGILPLKAQNDYVLKIGGEWLRRPPGYVYASITKHLPYDISSLYGFSVYRQNLWLLVHKHWRREKTDLGTNPTVHHYIG